MSEKPQSSKYVTSLCTLDKVSENLDKFCNTMGVIFDATGFYKTNRSNDYVVKLRLLDESMNPRADKYSSGKTDIEPYLMVLLFFKEKDSAITVPRLGDIMVLQSFLFSINDFKGKRYLTAFENQSCSSWQVYEGAEGGAIKPINSDPRGSKGYFYNEMAQIVQLRNWRRKFFSSQTLTSMCWYDPYLPEKLNPKERDVVFISDSDVLAKLVSEFRTEVHGKVYSRLYFQDKQGTGYLCEVQSSAIKMTVGEVYKLRSFTVQQEGNKKLKRLIFYEHSAILQLPGIFFDHGEILRETKGAEYPASKLEKQFISEWHLEGYTRNTVKGISVFSPSDEAEPDLVEVCAQFFPSLNEYDLEDVTMPGTGKPAPQKTIGSVVKLAHAELEITKVSEIERILAECHQDLKRCGSYNGRVFRIKVELAETPKINVNECFQFYLTKSQKVFELNKFEEAMSELRGVREALPGKKRGQLGSGKEESEKKVQRGGMNLILNIPFKVRDKNAKNPVTIQLINDDGNPDDIFELWKIFESFTDHQQFIRRAREYGERLEENLRKITSPNVKLDLAVTFVEISGRNPYLKIVDSKFWFLD